MKKLILILGILLLAGEAWGTGVYYIDPTCTTSGTGTSQTCDAADGPFKTWAEVSWEAGSSYVQKRGTTAREQITVGATGSVGNVIFIDGYGGGNNPKIYGSTLVTGWSQYLVTAIYSATCAWVPKAVWQAGTRLTNVAWNTDIATTAAAMSAGTWTLDDPNNLIYVWATDGADPDTHAMEVATRSYCITATDRSYININGIDCRYTNSHGIHPTVSAGVASNWTVRNSNITGTFSSGISIYSSGVNKTDGFNANNNTISDFGGDTANVVNGIFVGNGDGVTIYSNTITVSPYHSYNDYVFGIQHLAGTVANTGTAIYNNTITGSTLADTLNAGILVETIYYANVYGNIINGDFTRGLWVDIQDYDSDDAPQYCNFYGNHITLGVNGFYGIVTERGKNNNYYYNIIDVSASTQADGKAIWMNKGANNNTFYNNTVFGGAGEVFMLGWTGEPAGGTGENTLVKNNIFYRNNTTHATIKVEDNAGSVTTGIVFDYNLYYDKDYTGVVSWFGDSYNTIAAWNAAVSTQEAHYQSGDPQFISTTNFQLKGTSPAIDKGTNVSLTSDYIGTRVPIGLAQDMGALEYPYGTSNALFFGM